MTLPDLAHQARPMPPGARRDCSWLACPAAYDAIAVAEGTATAAGWRQWPSLDLRMCPAHSWVWVPRGVGDTGPHQPRLDGTGRVAPVLVCSCGRWSQDSLNLTAGKLAQPYLLHLVDEERAAAARAAFERAGTYLGDTATLDAELAEIADKATGSHAIAKRALYESGDPEYPGGYAVLCDLLAVTAAFRAALGMAATPTATDLATGEHRKIGPMVHHLDGAAHSVWLHGKWWWLTKNMTTEEREAFADAVERYSATLEPEDPVRVDRWWRDPEHPDGQPTPPAPAGEETPINPAFERSVLTGEWPTTTVVDLPVLDMRPPPPSPVLELLVPGGPLLRLRGPNGDILAVFHDDGRVEVPGKPDEAAAAFWAALRAGFPGLLAWGSDQWPVYVVDDGIRCDDSACPCSGVIESVICGGGRITLGELRQAVATHRKEHRR